ncbi:AsmA family protein [Biformimicrobium ophioploci]|uniref:AsmA family protein n=1 Tax=Biformimicrobium ophioploci TaxID=3036711 RepID=A0ABQ6LVZ1_9GAMM|nr:AsmA family protein [Microbulbifer sp. NKW57]GMG86261.1 AsmA family protein [Microbulbifer sp. NKW57]
MLKKLFIFLMVLVAIFVGALAWLVFAVDPNQYKPQLQDMAAKQGIKLELAGDIGWQFWPSIGLQVSDVSIAPNVRPLDKIVQAEQLSVGVALMPLLQKKIHVADLALHKPTITLTVDEQGRGNWEAFSQLAAVQQSAPLGGRGRSVRQTASANGLDLAVDQVSISDGTLSYSNAQDKSSLELRELDLVADSIQLGGDPGALDLSAQLHSSTLKAPVDLELEGTVGLDKALRGLRLQPLTLRAGSGDASATVNLRGNVQRKAEHGPWQLQVSVDGSFKELKDWLKLTGTELETRDPSAMQRLTLNTELRGDTDKMQLEPLQLQLDDFKLTGLAEVDNTPAVPNLTLRLQGEDLVVDGYLPPQQEGEEESAAAAPVAAPAALLPLGSLRGFTADLQLTLNRLQALDLTIEQPRVAVTANNGLVTLKELGGGLFGGKFETTGKLDAREELALVEFTGGLLGVKLDEVQGTYAPSDKFKLGGNADIKWQGRTGGVTDKDLQEQLEVNASLGSADMTMAPINVERGLCELVAYVERGTGGQSTEQAPAAEGTEAGTGPKQWPAETRLQNLQARIHFLDNIAKVSGIQAGVENLTLTGDGKVDLNAQNFDFALGLSVQGEATSEDGCSIKNPRWRNRILPLRCAASFDAVSATTCKPDTRRLDDLIRDEAEHKLRKKYGDKIDEKKEELKDKLKGLFKR